MAYPVEQADPTRVVGRRVLAVIIDAVLVLVPTFLLMTARFEYLEVADLGNQTGEQFCDDYMDETSGVCFDAEDIDDRVYFSDDTMLGAQGYYLASNVLLLVVLQGITGWTPGKLLTGIRVRKAEGGPPGLGKAAIRWVLWIADGFPYVLPGLTGFIVALSTPGHRRVGDMAASTFVVKRAAIHTPLSVEDGGRILVGDQAAAVTVPSWAPPPTTPGCPGADADAGHRRTAVGRRAGHVHPVGRGAARLDAMGRGLQGLDPHPGAVALVAPRRWGSAVVGGGPRGRGRARRVLRRRR
jgi:hypothetical protein